MKTFILIHPSGVSAIVSDLGATLQALSVPDRDGKPANILVGWKTREQWLTNDAYFGSTVGRYANRIAGGKFSIDGNEYPLPVNNGANHLHGGITGFDKVVWKTESTTPDSVKFTYLSHDGEEGYPGNLSVSVEYIIGEKSLTWRATAQTDAPTPVNLTNHAFFNLTGNPTTEVLGHHLQINADEFLPFDDHQIPTGEHRPVVGSGFDFTTLASIGENLANAELSFDHNYVLRSSGETCLAAISKDPASGRIMELYTDQPGLQFYLASPHGIPNTAFCLEPQKFPDSPNQSAFPSSILRPGETYTHEIIFYFPDPS
ncbi:MAG: galactose mutarotase [Akkermansiaceae bacterium]|nr:galactose mutarotase [Akkermansiaceae bacterium]MDP4646512.1 galactose mutarotase [Akkermansiaceae bacterium]MDP4720491.1 galactose mutarotase [Akkermansiaceae bacterium]MDP4779327.1 galactose mutarotase [Akkermansiaceae bacterium]MDP4896535.1 galactose mutarotase [Akkermansiaceae bacterium]